MTTAADIRLVLTTLPSPAEAERLATQLVDEGLAACVNIVPGLVSIYRWQDAVQRDAELLLVLKTTEAGYPGLEARLRELHPYQVPEILALTPSAGLPAYLGWLATSLSISDT